MLRALKRFTYLFRARTNRAIRGEAEPHLYNVWAEREGNPWRLSPDGTMLEALVKGEEEDTLYQMRASRVSSSDITAMVTEFASQHSASYALVGALLVAYRALQDLHPLHLLAWVRMVDERFANLASLLDLAEAHDPIENPPALPDCYPLLNRALIKAMAKDN